MTEMEYIKKLEERVEQLESMIKKITIIEGKNISFSRCPLDTVFVPEGCSLTFNNCPIGSVISRDIDIAEDKIDDLESTIDDAEDRISDLESRLEDIVDQIDDIDDK